jgi:hypothetical protein
VAVGGLLYFRPWAGDQRSPENSTENIPLLKGQPQVWVGDEKEMKQGRLFVEDDVAILEDEIPPHKGIRIMGHLSQRNFWYIVWLDTRGLVTVPEGSVGKQFEYPRRHDNGKGLYVPVDANDPLGTHLLLVVAGSVEYADGSVLLKPQLASVGKPPTLEKRGPGGPPRPAAELPIDYLKRIDRQLPPGLQRVYALFFNTGN